MQLDGTASVWLAWDVSVATIAKSFTQDAIPRQKQIHNQMRQPDLFRCRNSVGFLLACVESVLG
jgi:hypothetical protein